MSAFCLSALYLNNNLFNQKRNFNAIGALRFAYINSVRIIFLLRK